MTAITPAGSTVSQQTPASMRGEIETKWGKLSAADIAGMKTNDDLVALVQSRYNIGKDQAAREVETFAQGRKL